MGISRDISDVCAEVLEAHFKSFILRKKLFCLKFHTLSKYSLFFEILNFSASCLTCVVNTKTC